MVDTSENITEYNRCNSLAGNGISSLLFVVIVGEMTHSWDAGVPTSPTVYVAALSERELLRSYTLPFRPREYD